MNYKTIAVFALISMLIIVLASQLSPVWNTQEIILVPVEAPLDVGQDTSQPLGTPQSDAGPCGDTCDDDAADSTRVFNNIDEPFVYCDDTGCYQVPGC
tara:strand:+ start:170 stop:463 length:294 start_codon:yes stop_codon:yes gene_type:complete